MSKHGIRLYQLSSGIAALLLPFTTGRHDAASYVAVRCVVCAVAVYGVFLYAGMDRWSFTVALAVLAVLFNPLFPVSVGKRYWVVVDLLAATTLALSGLRLRMTKKSASSPPQESEYE